MSYAVVRMMPESRRGEWPKFLLLPDWACDAEGLPTKNWEIWFQGVRKKGRSRWFIWRILGLFQDWDEVKERLARRAGKFGLTCVYIYHWIRPNTEEMQEFINEINRKNGHG